MGQKGVICYMDDEIHNKKPIKVWEEGEYEAFIERFRLAQQTNEECWTGRDKTVPYREFN